VLGVRFVFEMGYAIATRRVVTNRAEKYDDGPTGGSGDGLDQPP
jgi:hypothetical protein